MVSNLDVLVSMGAIIGGMGGHVPQKILLGGRKYNRPPNYC